MELSSAGTAKTFELVLFAFLERIGGGTLRPGSGFGLLCASHRRTWRTDVRAHGQVMADVMAGRSERNPRRTLEWPAVPGHFGKPWFLPIVGAYDRLQDWLH